MLDQEGKGQKPSEYTTNVLHIKNMIDNSVQMKFVRDLEYRGELRLHNFRAPRFFAVHASTKSNLNTDKLPVLTEWAHSINWNDFNSDILDWIRVNCKKAIYDDSVAYAQSKLPYHLSYFNPEIHLGNFIQYGLNKGKWTDRIYKTYFDYLDPLINQISWTKDDIKDIDKGITDWEELILACPMLALIRKDATSAYPFYKKQTVDFILENYYDSIRCALSGYVTSYHRRHGMSREFKADRVVFTEKDRWVGGVEFASKLKGLHITSSFKDSLPSFTPYYRDWTTIFDDLLDKVMYSNTFVFTSDQAGFDQRHNSILVKDLGFKMMSYMPDHVRQYFQEILNSDYNNPKVVLNARYYVTLGRWISVSGSAPTPLLETLNNIMCHLYALDKLGVDVHYHLTQIDDTIFFVDSFSHEKLVSFCEILEHDLGFVVNPDKTETSEKGHLTYLQVNVGPILSDDLGTISNKSWQDGYGYLGYLMRRIHRLRFRERIFQSGDFDILYEDDQGNYVDIPIIIARFLGTVSSLGPYLPVELLDVILSHFKTSTYIDEKGIRRNFFDYVIDYCKRVKLSVSNEFGFDPTNLIKYLSSVY